jgi:23S rRNA G2445 N2-methylase RlmL
LRPAPVARTKRSSSSVVYYAQVAPGLEEISGSELRSAGAEVVETLAGFDKRDSIIVFHMNETARALKCGTIEDVFEVVLDAPTGVGRRAPHDLARKLERPIVERALLTHNALRPGKHGRSYKVVARVAGQHLFRRDDVESAFARALDLMLAKWVPARGKTAALELWAQVIGERTLVGVRLSDDTLAQRTYKKAHLPASLKPTVARALVLMAELKPGMVVLDPMCGAGTILREAAESVRGLTLIGGDNDPEALEAGRVNAGKQATLELWDATKLPLDDASVDAVITNPPYGRQHEAIPGLGKLYRQAMREAARVLRPGGQCVVLTGEPRELSEALPKTFRIRSKRRILLRGLPVTAFVIVRE